MCTRIVRIVRCTYAYISRGTRGVARAGGALRTLWPQILGPERALLKWPEDLSKHGQLQNTRVSLVCRFRISMTWRAKRPHRLAPHKSHSTYAGPLDPLLVTITSIPAAPDFVIIAHTIMPASLSSNTPRRGFRASTTTTRRTCSSCVARVATTHHRHRTSTRFVGDPLIHNTAFVYEVSVITLSGRNHGLTVIQR